MILKRKVFKNKFSNCFIPLFLGLLFVSCSSIKNIDEPTLIRKTLLSREFEDNFQICKNKSETNVYNDSKNNLDFIFSDKSSCLKTVTFSNINFNYNVNNLTSKNKGIVYLGMENRKNINELHFFDLETNLSIKFQYNKKNELVNLVVGNF